MKKYEEIVENEIVRFMKYKDVRFTEDVLESLEVYREDWETLIRKNPYDDYATNDLLYDLVQMCLDFNDIWKNNYVFSYINKTENYSEYDGFIENAPDEETAWDLFLSYSGEFGIADPAEYLCTEIENKGE